MILISTGTREAFAERGFVSSIPNGTLNDSNSRGDGCGHCHVLPGSKSRNAFGSRWSRIGWGPLLASEDSDDDGVSNGWELGDPQGTWARGQSDPGNPALVTSPGQEGSVPPVLSVSPLEVDHTELQGENLSEPFSVENVGSDCFGNPIGACTLEFDASTADAWMSPDPEFAELAPLESQVVDILFDTDGLSGGFNGSVEISALGVWNAPQTVLVTLAVPEPKRASLDATAALLLIAMAVVSRRTARSLGEGIESEHA
jgi:hypothetical protein